VENVKKKVSDETAIANIWFHLHHLQNVMQTPAMINIINFDLKYPSASRELQFEFLSPSLHSTHKQVCGKRTGAVVMWMPSHHPGGS